MIFIQLHRHTTIALTVLTLGLLCINSTAYAAETKSTNRCSAITLKNGAALLNVPIDDLQKSSTDLMVSPDDLKKKIYKSHPFNCSIRSKSEFLKFITYIIYEYNDSGQAHIEFNKMRQGFESISKVDIIPDIGDAAFWAGDQRFQRMVAIKGGVVIDALNPKEFDLQMKIISLVLDHF
jgi:hypothetical protein